MDNQNTAGIDLDKLRASAEYGRVKEEFKLATSMRATFCVESAMLNVDSLLTFAIVLAHRARLHVSEQADERALFEREANAARFFPRELDFSRTKSPSGRDEYANGHLQSRWEGWQARAALTQQAAPQASTKPQCDNCDGKGGWKTGEWVDPISGPECSYERCEVCMGTGREPDESPVATTAPTARQAEAPYEHIYQVWQMTGDGGWLDTDKDHYNSTPEDYRRITYIPATTKKVDNDA